MSPIVLWKTMYGTNKDDWSPIIFLYTMRSFSVLEKRWKKIRMKKMEIYSCQNIFFISKDLFGTVITLFTLNLMGTIPVMLHLESMKCLSLLFSRYDWLSRYHQLQNRFFLL